MFLEYGTIMNMNSMFSLKCAHMSRMCDHLDTHDKGIPEVHPPPSLSQTQELHRGANSLPGAPETPQKQTK